LRTGQIHLKLSPVSGAGSTAGCFWLRHGAIVGARRTQSGSVAATAGTATMIQYLGHALRKSELPLTEQTDPRNNRAR
jgi:hypothetical protein